MKEHGVSPEVINELIRFLSPNVNRNLRQQALDYVIGLSASDHFDVIFQANDFLLGRSLCRLICEGSIDDTDVLPAIINATATEVVCAKYVTDNTELVQRCIEYSRDCNDRYSLNAAKLLTNLSLHFPDSLYDALVKDWEDFIPDAIRRLNDSMSREAANYLGYVLVNLTSIANVRCLLCEKYVRQILPLVDWNTRPRTCLIAIDILRNMCFENSKLSVRSGTLKRFAYTTSIENIKQATAKGASKPIILFGIFIFR
ncbi:unnamed protein product [Wuchereria bancrofti]|uniref:Uncharacterized protein n=1 Tax=Wuchereria bancrofti TaxID=6293 RepID=A0A3P7E522_WUCBA|nr:unnamed protein product [Wuchereria bancrofti]